MGFHWGFVAEIEKGPKGPQFYSVSVAAAIADIDSDIDVFNNNPATNGNNYHCEPYQDFYTH